VQLQLPVRCQQLPCSGCYQQLRRLRWYVERLSDDAVEVYDGGDSNGDETMNGLLIGLLQGVCDIRVWR
jgi:hypothetical protein